MLIPVGAQMMIDARKQQPTQRGFALPTAAEGGEFAQQAAPSRVFDRGFLPPIAERKLPR